MEIKYCKKCNKLFKDLTGRTYCNSCKEEMDNLLSEVKTYIKENRTCLINDVATKFDVSVKQIMNWIAEEEISLTKDSSIKIYCKECKEQILSGQYCDKCKNRMIRSINDFYKPKIIEKKDIVKKDDKNRMRFIRNKDK